MLNKKQNLALLVLTVLFPVFFTPVWAQTDYQLGVDAYKNKQFDQARVHWEKATEEGNMTAAFNLAIMLSKGSGGEVDVVRAASLLQRVAGAGIAVGQYNLALAYYNGKGVEQDFEQAREWWEKAARQGHNKAQFNLGAMLWNGQGVEKDPEEAVKWLRSAADSGNIEARAFLDTLFEQSDNQPPAETLDTPDTDPDPTISAMLQQASRAYKQENYAGAFNHWSEAAKLGNAIAEYHLARLYRDGRGIEKDTAQAYSYTERSAKQGLAQAQYALASFYLDGIHVTKNETLALYWLQSAADQGHLQASDHLERLR